MDTGVPLMDDESSRAVFCAWETGCNGLYQGSLEQQSVQPMLALQQTAFPEAQIFRQRFPAPTHPGLSRALLGALLEPAHKSEVLS